MAQDPKELKEILKLSQSIGKAYSDLGDISDKRNKKLKEEADIQKSIVSNAKDEASARKAILKLQERAIANANKKYGVNASIGKQLQATNTAAQKTLGVEVKRQQVLGRVNSITDSIGSGIEKGLDTLESGISEIPILGKYFNKLIPFDAWKSAIPRLGNAFKGGFKGAFSSANIASKGFVKSFGGGLKSGFSGMAKAASRLGPALMGPQAIIGAIVAVLALGVLAFYNIEKAARAFRDETGLLNSQTQQMSGNINKVYMETVGLGASMGDVSKAASDFTNEFGGIEQPMASTMKSMIVLSKNFGISTQDAAKLNKAFQNMGGLSEDVAQSNIEALTALAAQEGVAPRQVMADIAESAEEANGFFRGNVQAMGAAAVNAAKLGTSLKKAVEISKGLLNYQDSVSSEMEASALLQTNLNFSQSRYMAAQGDVVGAQAEMVKQLRNQVDLNNLNVFEQEALEKATKMTLGEMQNMARLQELNLGLDKERDKVLQKAIKAGLDIKNMTRDQILAKTEELAKQQELQGEIESMGNELKGLGMELLQTLAPFGKMLVGAFKALMPIAQGFFKPIGRAFQGIIDAIQPLKDIFNEIFPPDKNGVSQMSGVLSTIGSIMAGPLTFAINLFANGIKMVSSLVTGVFDVFKGLMNGNFDQVLDGLLSIGDGILRFFLAIPRALLDTFINIFPGLGEWLSGLWTSIKNGIKNALKGMLPNWALRLLGYKSGGSEVQASAMNETSVNDAVITPGGEVVKTNPSDYIFATKDPSSLAPNMAMDGVIAELKEIKAVFAANKDVYIDNEKITSRITRTQEKSINNLFGLLGA